MSQLHVNYILANLCGDAPYFDLACASIEVSAVQAIGDDWQFDPEDDYCPVTFGGGLVPDDVCGKGTGVHFSSNGKLYVVGDNGQCAFYYRLSRTNS